MRHGEDGEVPEQDHRVRFLGVIEDRWPYTLACNVEGWGRNLHVGCAWMLVSSWPQAGQVVGWGSQFSSLCPTGSFFHSAVPMNVMSPTGNFNSASAVHVSGV